MDICPLLWREASRVSINGAYTSYEVSEQFALRCGRRVVHSSWIGRNTNRGISSVARWYFDGAFPSPITRDVLTRKVWRGHHRLPSQRNVGFSNVVSHPTVGPHKCVGVDGCGLFI